MNNMRCWSQCGGETVDASHSFKSSGAGSSLKEVLSAEAPVVFFSNGIGDSLLSLPALRALTTLFPERLVLVCPPVANRLCYNALPFRRVVEVSQPPVSSSAPTDLVSYDPRYFDAHKVAAEVGSCDVFMSIVPWHSGCLEELVFRLMPHTTIGLFPFYDIRVPVNGLHASDMAFEVPRAIMPGLRLNEFAAPPPLSSAARRNAKELRAKLPVGTRVLVVHPDTTAERCWMWEKYVNVIDAFLDRRPEFFVFVVGRSYENLECGRNGDRVVSCLGLALDVSIALVGEADLFLGVNSCMLHAADLYGIPAVGLFGPSAIQDWGFRFGPHRHVVGTISTSDIEEEAVLSALDDVVSERTDNNSWMEFNAR